MSRHRAARRARLSVVRLALAVTAAVGGVLAAVLPAEPPGVAAAAAGSPAVTIGSTAALSSAAPVRVRIPVLGVDSALDPLGSDGAGALVPPEDFSRAGWFTGSPVPGEVGPAVVAGHVDSYTGPGVFVRLAELRAGDVVLVDRADDSTVRFTVTRVGQYGKDDFPTEEVYGPTPMAELRLITCGGTFDQDRRSYLDNVVVYARATGGGSVA